MKEPQIEFVSNSKQEFLKALHIESLKESYQLIFEEYYMEFPQKLQVKFSKKS